MDIAIISGVLSTSEALKRQLVEFASEFVDVVLYGIEDFLPDQIDCDLMIYSSDICYEELQSLPHKIRAKEEIIALRTVNFETIDELFRIQKDEKVYVFNDAKATTYQFIEHLRNIGLEDINLIPYFPGTEVDSKIRYAITPGYLDRMPENIEHLINVGPRLFDLETIQQILKATGIINKISGSYSENYLSKIINISKRSGRYAAEVNALNEQMSLILSTIDEGIMVIDKKNKLSIVNKQLLELLSMPYRNFEGCGIEELIRNQDIVDFCIGIKQKEEAIFTIQHINLIFSRQKLSSGFIIIFVKNIEERILESNRLNQELVKKGHVAKYSFDHILGTSHAIKEAKYIAHKLAKSELTILIEGESGTGKELFASAIHNESHRASKAYLAINFSAFTDELIESELFGYEDGAFTGARKGGKVGLFELASGGTLLLDEIGDVSPKMQTKLLRVLQEGEIIRIGGTIIRSVDVRIIAATNKNLRKLVEEGAFREDLYYRLKMGTVKLPPLCQRTSDIPVLIERFLRGNYTMTEEAKGHLMNTLWKGNIRELKGTVEYMMAISDHDLLTQNELPKDFETIELPSVGVTDHERRILEVIFECNRQSVSCGRQNIQAMTYAELGLTENQIRQRMIKLAQKGLIKNQKGRGGSFVTEEGKKLMVK